MPISSGALGWPTSYFRKDEQEDATSQHAAVNDNNNDGNHGNEGVWRVQLADRDEYDAWKMDYDKMERKWKKNKKKKKKKQLAKQQKEQVRDDATLVLQRYRRRRCLALSCCLLLLFSAIFYGLVFLYTFYLEEDNLEPAVDFQSTCGGIWRKHFLVYSNTLPNGTQIYFCCFMPDINATAVNWVLAQGDTWPSGYLIRQNDCTPSGQKCEDFEKANTFSAGTPPCSLCDIIKPSLTFYWVMAFVVGILLRFDA